MTQPIRSVRLQRRSSDSLNVLSGSAGEIFFDADLGALRLYTTNNNDRRILADRTWVVNNTFDGDYNKLTNKPTIPADTADLTNGAGFVTQQEVDQAVGGVDLTGYATEAYVDNAVSAIPGVDLTGYATETFVADSISNLIGAAPAALDTLNELASALANDSNFAGTITAELGAKAPLDSPTFTGTVSGITASMVGLGNVTNESKTTMFTSPTFTGTVSGVTKTHVGLGNVLNVAQEPAIAAGTTGQYWRGDKTWQVLNASAVGLSNVTNESKATMFTSPTFTNPVLSGTTTIVKSTEILNVINGATGIVTHNFDDGAIWYHRNIVSNFTPNFTNIPFTDNKATSLVLVLVQGATPYVPDGTSIQLDGAPYAINWLGGSAPTGNANSIDVVSFTLLRTSVDGFYILGSLTSYGIAF